MRRLLVLLLLACLPASAWAGQTARYLHRSDGSTMVIEVEGDSSRLQISTQNWYVLTTAGQTYIVYELPAGPQVMRLADLGLLFAERRLAMPMPRIDPSYRLVPRGQTTIAGQRGLAYHLRTRDGVSSVPILVVSNAPALAALGVPFSRQMDFSIMIGELQGRPPPPIFARTRQLIGTGTALVVAGYILRRIETAPIAAARFALPVPPMPLDQLRRNIEANSPPT